MHWPQTNGPCLNRELNWVIFDFVKCFFCFILIFNFFIGLIEEHGHYGLWSICTNKLIPVELIDDGRMYGVANCEPMNTFFKPTHYRPLIAVFCLAHLASLFAYTFLLMIRLMEIIIQESNRYNENDLETNQSHAKRFMVISARYFTTNQSGQSREEKVKRQIRIKLYIISLAGMTHFYSNYEFRLN